MRDRCKLSFHRPSLARSREARFACLNRRACSQAKVSVNQVFLLHIFKFFAFFKYVLKKDVNAT